MKALMYLRMTFLPYFKTRPHRQVCYFCLKKQVCPQTLDQNQDKLIKTPKLFVGINPCLLSGASTHPLLKCEPAQGTW